MNLVLLNNVDHADLRVAVRSGAAYGDSVNQLPLYPAEFEEAQRDFPIMFRRTDDGIQAFALLGLDRDENLFLKDDAWTSRYVPAIQRRGPFSIGVARPKPGEAVTGEPMIHIDLDDPRAGATDGHPIFLQHGGNAPYLDHVSAVLRIIYQGLEVAQAAYAELDAAGLLQPVTVQINLSDEDGYELPDLFAIDQQALADLSGEALDRLHRSGLLRLATMAAASLGNVSRLIDLKNARQAAA